MTLSMNLADWALPSILPNLSGRLTHAVYLGGPTYLVVNGVSINCCNSFVCLGSVISVDLFETHAIKHRIDRAWSCFHKWDTILLSSAPLNTRLAFWSLTVLPSLLWGLETTWCQAHTRAFKKLASCQRLQVCKMLKFKRKPLGNGTLEP